jgi:hypothetical protein
LIPHNIYPPNKPRRKETNRKKRRRLLSSLPQSSRKLFSVSIGKDLLAGTGNRFDW